MNLPSRSMTAIAIIASISLLAAAPEQRALESTADVFESALLDLGAVPLAKLARGRLFKSGRGVYKGWLSPYEAMAFRSFAPGEKERFHIAQSRDEVISRFEKLSEYLDFQKFPLTKEPNQEVLLRFMLEIAANCKSHPIEKPNLLRLFHEYHDLASVLVPLLESRVSWLEAADLFNKTGRDEALKLFPAASSQNIEYLHALKKRADDDRLDVFARWKFQGIIDRANGTDFGPSWTALGVNCMQNDVHPSHRMNAFLSLADKAPDVLKEQLATLLRDEPAIVLKRLVLYHATQEQIAQPEMLETAMELADFSKFSNFIQDGDHFTTWFSEWLTDIEEYLLEMRDSIRDPVTQQHVTQRLKEIGRMRTEQFRIIVFSPRAKCRDIEADFPEENSVPGRAVLINRLPPASGVVLQSSGEQLHGLEDATTLHINGQGEVIGIDGRAGLDVRKSLMKWRFQALRLNGKHQKVDLLCLAGSNLLSQRLLPVTMGLLPETGFTDFTRSRIRMMSLIKGPLPIFPGGFHRKGGQKTVVTECMTDIYGRCRTANVVRSAGAPFDNAVLRAARRWVIEPYIGSGIPRPIAFNLNVIFVY